MILRSNELIRKMESMTTFNSESHTYLHESQPCLSMSGALKYVCNKFDAHAVSLRMAKGNAEQAKKLREEWDSKRNDSIDRGNGIHEPLEAFFATGQSTDPLISKIGKCIISMFPHSKEFHPEVRFFMKVGKKLFAGTSDLVMRRGNTNIYDFEDHKTNLAHGIRFLNEYQDKKTDTITWSEKFMLYPLDYIEECEFTKYALQLSGYAYMFQKTAMEYFNKEVKIGSLSIVHIGESHEPVRIPVPYMKSEVEILFNFIAECEEIC